MILSKVKGHKGDEKGLLKLSWLWLRTSMHKVGRNWRQPNRFL